MGNLPGLGQLDGIRSPGIRSDPLPSGLQETMNELGTLRQIGCRWQMSPARLKLRSRSILHVFAYSLENDKVRHMHLNVTYRAGSIEGYPSGCEI